MRRHHINAKPDEWFHVHREKNGGGGDSKPPWWVYLIGGIIGLVIVGAIVQWLIQFITAILPWLALGVVGLVIGKLFLASKR